MGPYLYQGVQIYVAELFKNFKQGNSMHIKISESLNVPFCKKNTIFMIS